MRKTRTDTSRCPPCKRVGVMAAPGWSVGVVIKLALETRKRNLILSTTFPYHGRMLYFFLTRIFLPKANVAFRLCKSCMNYWTEQGKEECNEEKDMLSGWGGQEGCH